MLQQLQNNYKVNIFRVASTQHLTAEISSGMAAVYSPLLFTIEINLFYRVVDALPSIIYWPLDKSCLCTVRRHPLYPCSFIRDRKAIEILFCQSFWILKHLPTKLKFTAPVVVAAADTIYRDKLKHSLLFEHRYLPVYWGCS